MRNLLLSLFTLLAVFSQGQTMVTSLNDFGSGTLREAVFNASTNDTILFSPSLLSNGSDTIKLTFPIIFTKGVYIKGMFSSTDTIYISGQDSTQIFYMDFEGSSGVKIHLEDLAIIEGKKSNSDPNGMLKNNGGAIMAYGLDTLHVTNSVFRNNNCLGGGHGGAIFLYYVRDCTINGTVFESNSAGQAFVSNNGNYGGAIYFKNGGLLEIINSDYIENFAVKIGGAIHCDGVDLKVTESDFLKNSILTSYGGGGALSIYADSIVFIEKSIFKENNSDSRGGAISIGDNSGTSFPTYLDSNSVFSNCIFYSNEAQTYKGGAIFCGYVDLVISNCSFFENKSNTGGGGFGFINCQPTILGCTFNNNEITNTINSDGVEISGGYSHLNIINTTIKNTVSNSNTALIVNTISSDSLIIIGSIVFSSNGSSSIGGLGYKTSLGNNIFSDSPTFKIASDLVNIDSTSLDILPLGDYGGLTPTMMPGPNSVAVNAGKSSDLSNAQNGPIYGIRDIGAAERRFIAYDTALVCGSYSWWGNTYTEPGTYTDSVYTGGLLDSTGILVLEALDTSVINNNTYLISLEQELGTTYQWVNCNTGYSPIQGETDSVFQPMQNGQYAVIISRDGCTDTSNCIVYDQVHLDELYNGDNTLRFYPNPTSGQITLEASGSLPTSVEIYDLSGKQIGDLPITRKVVSLPLLKKGVYFLVFQYENGYQKTEKLIYQL